MMNYHRVIAPVMRHFRTRRMADFERAFAPSAATSIIDIGGYAGNWDYLKAQPSVLLVNIDVETHNRGRFKKVRGDGRRLAYADASFDIAYSNSVIEHVGTWENQKAFAHELRRVAKSYYVQTPNKHFPIEPHILTPFAQYLPKRFVPFIARWLSLRSMIERPSREWVENFASTTRLLTTREMRYLFPDATITYERVCGVPKSIIAYRI